MSGGRRTDFHLVFSLRIRVEMEGDNGERSINRVVQVGDFPKFHMDAQRTRQKYVVVLFLRAETVLNRRISTRRYVLRVKFLKSDQ